ncbi:MAG: DUF4070 domain-containing protein, partial [Bdellovibrionota bacterium]
ETLRPKMEILSDYQKVISECYRPEKYFGRVLRCALLLDRSRGKLRIPFRQKVRDVSAFFRLVRVLGIQASYRREFWNIFFQVVLRNPRALRYAMALMALYIHFGPFSRHVAEQVEQRKISLNQTQTATPVLWPSPAFAP